MVDLVSVIMPAYNSEKFITESIESVLAQTYLHWELIIVDDGSTDETGRIARYYSGKDKKITYIYQENQKQGHARNTGIKTCNGSILAFIDADDLWKETKLEKQVKCLKENNAALVFSAGYVFKNVINEIEYEYNVPVGISQGDEALQRLLKNNFIPLPSVMAYRHAVEAAGGFEEDYEIQNAEDYHLWIKMLLNGSSFHGMPDKLFYYRTHPAQSTSSDAYSCQKVCAMLHSHLQVPPGLTDLFRKAGFYWGFRWYQYNASNPIRAHEILDKMSLFPSLRNKALLIRSTLLIGGLKASNKLVRHLLRRIDF